MNNLHICVSSLDNFLEAGSKDRMWRALKASGSGEGREKKEKK